MGTIHPSAFVSKHARLGENVNIGPFAVVEDDVEIGDGSTLESHVALKNGTRIGSSVTVSDGAVIGGLPQDLAFKASTPSYAIVGDGARIREGVTINRATREGGATKVGENCYLMAASHVGHDCVLGANVVMANACLLAGFVTVGAFTVFGGNACVHQFCRIGEGAMVGGLSPVSMDVPPYVIVAERSALYGLNLVGLKRRGVPRESIRALQQCYRSVFNGTGKLRERAEQALAGELAAVPEARRFLEFFAEGKRGFAMPQRRK